MVGVGVGVDVGLGVAVGAGEGEGVGVGVAVEEVDDVGVAVCAKAGLAIIKLDMAKRTIRSNEKLFLIPLIISFR